MSNQFSKATRLWLEKCDVWRTAEDRLLRQWSEILAEVHRRFSAQEWVCTPQPSDMLQMHRGHWFNPDARGIHFEALCNREMLMRGIVDLSLHVEDRVPNQQAVCAKLRELLRPRAPNLLRLLAKYVPSLPDTPGQDIIKGRLPVEQATPEAVCEALELMTETESFVDEALFLAGKMSIWRTDFARESQGLWPEWFGKVGGQQAIPSAGRLGSCAWRLDGSQPNARPNASWESGLYSLLVAGDARDLVLNGREHYACVVLKTGKGGQVTVWADGHRYKPDQSVEHFPKAFAFTHKALPSECWQCISWCGVVPAVNEVKGVLPAELGAAEVSAPFDFAKDGVWIGLRVETEDRGFLIDSIEIGRSP